MLELGACIPFDLQALGLRLLGGKIPGGDGLYWLIH
jgi:hypothetical protein